MLFPSDQGLALTCPDTEDLGATYWASAVRRWPTVFEDDRPRVLDLPLLSTLETVTFHNPPPDSNLLPKYRVGILEAEFNVRVVGITTAILLLIKYVIWRSVRRRVGKQMRLGSYPQASFHSQNPQLRHTKKQAGRRMFGVTSLLRGPGGWVLFRLRLTASEAGAIVQPLNQGQQSEMGNVG